MSEPAIRHLNKLSPDERLKLLEKLWDSLEDQDVQPAAPELEPSACSDLIGTDLVGSSWMRFFSAWSTSSVKVVVRPAAAATLRRRAARYRERGPAFWWRRSSKPCVPQWSGFSRTPGRSPFSIATRAELG